MNKNKNKHNRTFNQIWLNGDYVRKLLLILLIVLIEITILFIPEKLAYTTKQYIYIDPGHGGFDGGAVVKDIVEKDLVLKVAYMLKDYFECSGYNVLMTRYKDTSLKNTKKEDIYKRVELINKQNTLIFISIHANTFPSSNVFGSQVFYKENNKNKILAETIQEYLRLVDNNKRFAKSISDKYILDHVNRTGCLVEIGFLSNEQDYNNLCNNIYLENLSKHIYLGVIDYLNKQGE